MTNATTLVEFLRARYDEIEAREWRRRKWREPRPEHFEKDVNGLRVNGRRVSEAEVEEMREPAPNREVLADVEAKRRIVAIHADYDAVEDIYIGHECIDDTNGLIRWYQADCPTLRLLALPFAAHPDYDQSWRPAEVGV